MGKIEWVYCGCGTRVQVDALCPKCDRICGHCGRKSSEHFLANYADGPFIGREILICPHNVFEEVPRSVSAGSREDQTP